MFVCGGLDKLDFCLFEDINNLMWVGKKKFGKSWVFEIV